MVFLFSSDFFFFLKLSEELYSLFGEWCLNSILLSPNLFSSLISHRLPAKLYLDFPTFQECPINNYNWITAHLTAFYKTSKIVFVHKYVSWEQV